MFHITDPSFDSYPKSIHNLTQLGLFINREFHIAVKLPHSADEFTIKSKALEYKYFDNDGVQCQVNTIVYQIDPSRTYEVIGVYKELEDKMKYRQEMIDKGMNLDENWIILKEI